MTLSRKQIVPLTLLVLVFAASVVLFFVPPRSLDQKIIFFPDFSSVERSLKGEQHYLPVRNDRQIQLQELVQATLQGPMSLNFLPLCPPDARVRSVYVRGNIAYIDVSETFLAPTSRLNLAPERRIDAIKTTIFYNFPDIREVRMYIKGQEMKSWPYVGKRKA